MAYAESGESAPELMALFGWTNLRTAQTYIETAQSGLWRATRQSVFSKTRTAKVSHFQRRKTPMRQIRKKEMDKQQQKRGMVGDERPPFHFFAFVFASFSGLNPSPEFR